MKRIWRKESKMGGNVAVTIREENGKEHRMCRWTNTLPWFINNIKLLNKDQIHLQKYLETWYNMREDYEKHKEKENFEQNMTPVYAPYPFLAPQDYGLVIIDMQKNHILSYQDYTIIGEIDAVQVRLDMDSIGRGGKTREMLAFYSEGNMLLLSAVRLRELYKDGRINGAIDYLKNERFDISRKSLDEIARLVESNINIAFEIDMSPYQVIRYKEHDTEEAQKMRADIKNLGFNLSSEEESIWDEWIVQSNPTIQETERRGE